MCNKMRGKERPVSNRLFVARQYMIKKEAFSRHHEHAGRLCHRTQLNAGKSSLTFFFFPFFLVNDRMPQTHVAYFPPPSVSLSLNDAHYIRIREREITKLLKSSSTKRAFHFLYPSYFYGFFFFLVVVWKTETRSWNEVDWNTRTQRYGKKQAMFLFSLSNAGFLRLAAIIVVFNRPGYVCTTYSFYI